MSLRKDFDTARMQLHELEPAVRTAGPEAQARYWLEMGRSYASHRHSPESQTLETRERARAAFGKALEIAKRAKLDAVTVDILHMFVFVDTAPADQLRWNLQALSVVQASTDPEARRWEASIRSNTGEALVELGRYDEALMHFRKTLVLREQGTNAAQTRDAHWHIAHILRLQNHIDEALAIQLRLEREAEAAQQPRIYIFEEIELLYRAKRQFDRAEHYADRVKAFGG
jgi:tetratricopeptide (TPR) repeat protein